MLRSILKDKPKTTLISHGRATKDNHESKMLDSHSEFSKNLGIQYLEDSVTDYGYQSIIGFDKFLKDSKPSPVEVFTSMLALDLHMKCCKNYSFIAKLINFLVLWHENGVFYFFQDQKLLPADVDCTAIGLSILFETNNIDNSIVDDIVDKILKNTNSDNIIQVYFDKDRPRVDPIVCINALYLINLVNRHEEKVAKETVDFVFNLLVKKEYKDHLRYYITEEQFFYFLSRLVNRFPNRFEKFIPVLAKEIESKIGSSTSPLNLAMRIIASHNINKANATDTAILRRLQSKHGYWEADAFFKYGRSKQYFGCRELTTAFAVKAIEQDEKIVPVKFHKIRFFDKKITQKVMDENIGLDITDEEMAKSQFGQGSNTAKFLRSKL